MQRGTFSKIMPKFASMNQSTIIQDTDRIVWSENVIIVDGDYVDSVAFHLIVNFERMLGRRIPQADTARWIDCIALDGGIRQGEQQTQVVFIHDKASMALQNFTPGNYQADLDGKAFKDSLGEFVLSSFPVEEVVTHQDFVMDVLRLVTAQKAVKRVMLVADMDRLLEQVKSDLRLVDDESKRITVFAMQPLSGGHFRQEILGYSLMNAMGISADEFKQ